MDDIRYKYSRFFHCFQRDHQACLYNALTMETIYTTVDEYDCARQFFESTWHIGDNSILKQMCCHNMILPVHVNEDYYIEEIRKKLFTSPHIRVMVLHMTDYCNLRCKYCFIEGGQVSGYRRQVMSHEIAKFAVDKFFYVIKGHDTLKFPSIVFYGGEPLLNWDTIKFALLETKQKESESGIKVDKVIITNGTILNDEIIEFIKRYNIQISVSLDGIQIVNDANRVDVKGQGSFERAVNTINRLIENGITPAVSCVMAKEGLQYVDDSIRFLIEDLGIRGLGFNHVSIIPGLNFYDPIYEEQFADTILHVQDEIQHRYPYVYERRMGHKVNMFLDKLFIKSDCTGCGEQFSVSPTGEIGICQGYMGSRKTFRKTVFDSEYNPEKDPVFIEWSKRSPLNIEKCLACPALATCGGGCPRNADMINDSIWEPDSAFCHFAKKAQTWLIWRSQE